MLPQLSAWQLISISLDIVCKSLPDLNMVSLGCRDFIGSFNVLLVLHLFPPKWHQLTVQCGWYGPSAGGPYLQDGLPSHTWSCNPQFRLIVRQSCEVVVCLSQRDAALPDPTGLTVQRTPFDQSHIGMLVVQTSVEQQGRQWRIDPADLVQELPLTADRQGVCRFTAGPNRAYYILPHRGQPGEDGPFVMRFYAGAALEVEQCPSPLSLVIGEWLHVHRGRGKVCCNPERQTARAEGSKSLILL